MWMGQQKLSLKPGQVQIAIKRSGGGSIFPQVWLNPACQTSEQAVWSLLLLSSSVQLEKGRAAAKLSPPRGIFYSKDDTSICIWVQ